MVCKKCGAEIKEGNKFCAKCGTPVEEVTAVASDAGSSRDVNQPKTEGKLASAGQPSGKKLPLVPIAVGAAVLLVAVAVGVASFFFLRGRNNSESADPATGSNTILGENSGDNTGNAVIDWQEMIPLYTIEDVPSVDIHAQNYAAGTKAPGIAWDNTLFYWLEDVDQTSTEDGYLAKCPITKMLLRNAENGSLIQYEIYRDPNTDEIYKIVSIEQTGDNLHLVDYYYQGGVPNFTFSRSDSVYTPTYATPAKVGERYYFNGDVLARWRMIREPNVIGEYVLAPTGASYSQADYFAESAEIQAIYDNTELRELNAARNTFDAVTAAGNGIGLVEGRVTDTAGNPVAGVTVDILRAEDGVLLYRAVTGEDGSFNIFVYLEDVECSIVIRGNETYDSNSVQGVMLARATGGSSYGNLLMHRLDGDRYPVHINVYSAVDVRTGEDGSLLRDLLTGAKVSLRAGVGAHTGEVLQTLETDGDGKVNTTLPAGTYTAQIDVDGYALAFVTVEVAEQETTVEGYVLPVPEADQTGIIMTWEGSADLDLTLFTPYQSTNGDMAHIGGRITEDGYGNSLVADNAAGCEVMYVNTAVLGNYKLYVNNYTEIEAGNYSSSQLSNLNIHIYIYDSNGLIAEYSFPAGQIGVVWEVADLNGGQVTPSQRVYVSLEGKSWWTENKEKMVLVQEIVYYSNGNQNSTEYRYDTFGNLVQKTTYGIDGISDLTEYTYDAVGNLLEAVSQDFVNGFFSKNEYSYDAVGNLVKHTNDSSEYGAGWTEYSYDVAGNLVKKTWYGGDLWGEWNEYSYDVAGNLVKETYYNRDGSSDGWTEYSFNATGNLVKKTNYNYFDGSFEGNVSDWYEYSYDAMGNKVKETRYNGDGSISWWYEYNYDAMGNKVKETYYNGDGSISWWQEYSYDVMGNQVKSIGYRSDGGIYLWYEYSYDAVGNKVKEISYNGDGSISWWREYSYTPLNSR